MRFDPKPPRGPASAGLLRGKTAGVLGLGRSGLAVANLLNSKGFKVLASDSRPRKEVAASAKKLKGGVKWEAGGHSDKLLQCAFVVKSPGILPSAPILRKLREASVPVFSELEVSLGLCKPKMVVAITGTNGKSTTTHMTAEAFKAARRGVRMGGNVGTALAALASKVKKKDTVVLEVSSYQLEDSRHFAPDLAAITNITADHIDHHGSMGAYIAAKSRVFSSMSAKGVCVFNADDPIGVKLSRQCRARKLFFGKDARAGTHAWSDGKKLFVKLPGEKKAANLIPPALPGWHNKQNAMAAALLALQGGVTKAQLQKAFKRFKGVEHRIEDCGSLRGLRCINDSKATNVESTMTALEALKDEGKKILLVLGGLHKGYPYTPLRPLIEACVKGILTIGSAAPKVEHDLSGPTPIFPCVNLEQAVRIAAQIGAKGDILLLSPACASFDQFKDYEDRGRRFKELVKKLAKS